MKRAFAILASASAFACVAPGCRPAKAPEMQLCQVVGTDTSEDGVKAAYAANKAPLVVTENAIQRCGCGVRRIGGAEERAKLGGNTEQDRLAGKIEENKLAGATEQGKNGGATEQRAAGGATEQGKNGGAMEQRAAGGGTEQGKNGGATEQRAAGGATERGQFGGDTERRKLAGAIEPLTCREVSDCLGYVVSGKGAIRVYASAGWVESANRCVVE
jgi:hypothetical protein